MCSEQVAADTVTPWARQENEWLRGARARTGRSAVWVLVSLHPGVLRVREQAKRLALGGDVDGALALLDSLADGYRPEIEQRPRTSATITPHHVPPMRARTVARPRERRERRVRRSSSSSGDDGSGSTSDSDSDPPGVAGRRSRHIGLEALA